MYRTTFSGKSESKLQLKVFFLLIPVMWYSKSSFKPWHSCLVSFYLVHVSFDCLLTQIMKRRFFSFIFVLLNTCKLKHTFQPFVAEQHITHFSIQFFHDSYIGDSRPFRPSLFFFFFFHSSMLWMIIKKWLTRIFRFFGKFIWQQWSKSSWNSSRYRLFWNLQHKFFDEKENFRD